MIFSHLSSNPTSPWVVQFLQLLEFPHLVLFKILKVASGVERCETLLTDCRSDLGWMEMSKLIPTLFLHFDVELTDPKAELREVCRYAHCLAPWLQNHN